MDDAADELGLLAERLGESDSILRALTESSGMGITLIVGGTLVSGVVCSAAEWFEEFGGLFDGGPSDEWTSLADRFRLERVEAEEFHREMRARLDSDPDATATAEERVKALRHQRRMVHLRDAALYTGGTRYPTDGGMLWRGRLSAVDGFMPGVFGQS